MSHYNSAGFITGDAADRCDPGPVVITYEGAQTIKRTIARMLALGPSAPFVCEDASHPRFVMEQRAREPHVCPICGRPMKREKRVSGGAS